MSWLVGGVVAQTTAEDAVFGGVLPLNIRLLGDRLTFTGGAVVASKTVRLQARTRTSWPVCNCH
jgi:hypothetical protein